MFMGEQKELDNRIYNEEKGIFEYRIIIGKRIIIMMKNNKEKGGMEDFCGANLVQGKFNFPSI